MSAKARFWILPLAAILLAGSAAVWLGRGHFQRWQERRLIEAARGFLQTGNLRAAYLSTCEALQKNPKSIAAGSIAARIAEIEHSPAAILWRQKLADMQPGTGAPLLDLAATATRFGETFIAEQALASLPASERDGIGFHEIAANLAIALKRYEVAEFHFQKALEKEPANEGLQLNLATLRLTSGRTAQAELARADLQRLRRKPQWRADVLRALLTDARRRGNAAQAMQFATELNAEPAATIGDRLLRLEELDHAQSKDFAVELSQLQNFAGKNPAIAYVLLNWMTAHGLASEGIRWCETFPPASRAQLPLPLAEAEARTALADWKQLGELIRDADWGDLECLRHAIHARVLFETDGQRRRAEFHSAWDSARNSTRGNPEALMMLGRLVRGWGWKEEAAEVWGLAARSGPGSRAALKALYELHSAEKNTRELFRVARKVYELEPQNPVAQNNFAALALVLGEDEAEARRLAAALYAQAPAQPPIASTYAFSLCKQQRPAEAVQILQRLPAAAFAEPSLGACYGLALLASGDPAAARPLLETADRQKAQLFPEQAEMVASALKSLP